MLAEVCDLQEQEVRERLYARERIGSTGFGRGVAIPHARMEEIGRPVVCVLQLASPVEFEAADKMPVELVFGLLSPEAGGMAHLHALAALSRMVRDDALRSALTEAQSEDALFALLTNAVDRMAA